MKTRTILLLWLSIAFAISIKAQNFTDNFNNETVNSIASKWGVVKGMAVVGELDGKKVLSLDRYTVAKPIVNGEDKNYLGDQFTIEFDAFFHEVPSLTRHYYIIHLWDGTGIYGENGEHTDPYKIYRHGISTSGTTVNRNRIEELGVLEQTWRHVKIAYANKTLKMFINGHLVLNHPNLFFDPPMVSFSARNASGETSGITNISITELVEGAEQPTEENPNGNSTAELNLPYTFPEYDGEANQILQTDGNGTLSWVDFSSSNSTRIASTGLEALDEGKGIGWRLIGRNPDGYDIIGQNAIDFSAFSDNGNFPANTFGATGQNSIAAGILTKASGRSSSAFGNFTDASGNASTSFGKQTQASGNFATVYGEGSIASGDYSAAYGYYSLASGYNTTSFGTTRAEAYQSVAVGKHNIGGGNPDNWVETDPLFEIGNSNTSYLSNALTVLKNGTITAPSFDITEITDPKALITKEYADVNYSGGGLGIKTTGLEAIDEGNGIGLRLAGSNPDKYGNIGEKAVDLSYATDSGKPRGATGLQSTAIGYNTTASGSGSTAMGRETIASGYSSVAMGDGTVASGMMSTAIGKGSIASGHSSVAMNEGTKASAGFSTAMGSHTSATGYASLSTGSNTRATGSNSTTMGYETKAEAYLTMAIGSKNIGGGDPEVWRGIDPLFEIGNGAISNTEDPSNALTVLKNGNIGIGTHTPQVKLHIQDGLDANNSRGGYLIIGDKQKENIVFDNNEIIARNNVQSAILYLQSDGGDVYVGRAIVHSSDKRLKQDIENLTYGLNEILQLRPVAYHWKTNPNATNKSLGLIAQDVQPILKELITVNTNNDNDTLGVNYTELIPILIKAIQEQQTIIGSLKTNLEDKDEAFNQLNERMKRLESLTINNR